MEASNHSQYPSCLVHIHTVHLEVFIVVEGTYRGKLGDDIPDGCLLEWIQKNKSQNVRIAETR